MFIKWLAYRPGRIKRIITVDKNLRKRRKLVFTFRRASSYSFETSFLKTAIFKFRRALCAHCSEGDAAPCRLKIELKLRKFLAAWRCMLWYRCEPCGSLCLRLVFNGYFSFKLVLTLIFVKYLCGKSLLCEIVF